MRRGLCVFVVAGVTVAVTMVAAMPIAHEIRKVPVERLAANLETQIQKTGDIDLQLNLARLYVMAYALKVTQLDAIVGRNGVRPDFGHMPPLIPGSVKKAATRAEQDRATVFLARAQKQYETVLQLLPNNFIAHLGYAWTLEESGHKARAIAEYRKVVELAWPRDSKESHFGQDPATMEAADRLVVLLDPVKDAKEIDSLRQKLSILERAGRVVTPIAIPLGPDNAGPPANPDARVRFDADGSGIPKRWSWIAPDAGWLVYDADGSGEITSALQWFGSVTFWLFWSNGYEAMRALDDNGDGELRGAELAHLAIWRDANQNGVSERGEVRPLSAHGIVALSCAYTEVDDPLVIAHSPRGVTFADGTKRTSFDLLLRASHVRNARSSLFGR